MEGCKKGRGGEGKGRGLGVTGGRLHGCTFPSLNFHTSFFFSVVAVFSRAGERVKFAEREKNQANFFSFFFPGWDFGSYRCCMSFACSAGKQRQKHYLSLNSY